MCLPVKDFSLNFFFLIWTLNPIWTPSYIFLRGGGVMVMQTWKNYHIPELYKETWSISQVKPYRYVASRNAALSFIFNINFSQIIKRIWFITQKELLNIYFPFLYSLHNRQVLTLVLSYKQMFFKGKNS